MRDDKSNLLPTLLELTSGIVANSAERILKVTESYSTEFSSPSSYIENECTSSSQTQENSATVALPPTASEAIFSKICESWRQSQEEPKALSFFYDGKLLPLSNIDLSSVSIHEEQFTQLLMGQQKNLTTLTLQSTKGINAANVCKFMNNHNIMLGRLKSLKLNSVDLLRSPESRHRRLFMFEQLNSSEEDAAFQEIIFPAIDEDLEMESLPHPLAQPYKKITGKEGDDDWEMYKETPQFIHFCPNVEHLYLLQGLSFNIEDETRTGFMSRIFEPLKTLKTLDLSDWSELPKLELLLRFDMLTSLVLYNVAGIEKEIPIISKMKSLKNLDLSQSDRSTGIYNQPVTALHTLIISLPNLECLDISGTNLASNASENDRPFHPQSLTSETKAVISDISGLSFLPRLLKFLGIFNCDSASHFKNLPAELICGDYGEDQLLLALETYMERPKMIEKVLNESYQLYRFGNNLHRHLEALLLVIKALFLHSASPNLQIAGSASLFYIIRNVRMNQEIRRRVIQTLLNGMELHIDEQVMVRNCCLSLCQFDIPREIMFGYSRVAKLLLRVLRAHNSDQLTIRIVVFLLNSMACHVEGNQKVEVGELGAIEAILLQIRKKLTQGVCDDVMEIGWSFLWNITDETPSNCNRFLVENGLLLFQSCFERFKDQLELVRNMMGLIGNIAEVQSLRSKLMDDNYLNIFCTLLESLNDGIEISYNSAGVLAHLASDGDECWSGVHITRAFVMDKIIEATNKWDLKTRRFINYRSFKPILRLVPIWNSPGSQQWAVWALANLTTTDPPKYCRFVQEEGGIELLEELITKTENIGLRNLALVVLENIHKWLDEVNNAEGSAEQGENNFNLLE